MRTPRKEGLKGKTKDCELAITRALARGLGHFGDIEVRELNNKKIVRADTIVNMCPKL